MQAGILLFNIFAGTENPFDTFKKSYLDIQSISADKLSFLENNLKKGGLDKATRKDLIELITNMLKKNPNERPSCEESFKRLQKIMEIKSVQKILRTIKS